MNKQSDEPSSVSWEPLKTIHLREFQVDVAEIERQLAARYSRPKDASWSWHLERTLSKHILIFVSLQRTDPGYTETLVWSKDGVTAWDTDSWSNFVQLVKDEGLIIADNLQDILDIFCFFQFHRKILHSEADLEFVREEKRALLASYSANITSPTHSCSQGKQEASFWTIDVLSGDLEEWLLTQTEERLHVQSWVRVERLILTLGLL